MGVQLCPPNLWQLETHKQSQFCQHFQFYRNRDKILPIITQKKMKQKVYRVSQKSSPPETFLENIFACGEPV